MHIIDKSSLVWQVEVSLSGVEIKEEDSKPAAAATAMKALPPWMIKQGMQLTKEQQGLVKQESKVDGLSSSNGLTEDKKSGNQEKDATQNLQVTADKLLLEHLSELDMSAPGAIYNFQYFLLIGRVSQGLLQRTA